MGQWLPAADESFEVTLEVPGVHDYYCLPHEMAGMVVGSWSAALECGLAGRRAGHGQPARNGTAGLSDGRGDPGQSRIDPEET
ncbi:plastocyanin/azurin family copper-binding protein [Roseovarius sp. MS2]|uniref:plastocyanin/azurin family copper-binding protein n=1 Tax=Roseovarius sp. MS2 TaxID=3390728 RepID=UPI003EDBC08B